MTNQYKSPIRMLPGLLFLTIIMVLFLAACGGSGNPPLITPPVGQVNSQSGTGGQPYPAQSTPQVMETAQSGAADANPAIPGDSNLLLTPSTLSPDQIATRDAFMNQSGKSAPIIEPTESTAKPGGITQCLGSLGTLLVVVITFVFITNRKRD